MPDSVWAGVGFGLVLASALGFRALDVGQPVPWGLCGTAFLFGAGLVPSVEFGLRGAWAVLTALVGAWLGLKERLTPPPDEDPDEPDPAPALPITEQLDRLERRRLQEVAHWQTYYRRLYGAGMAYGWDRETLTGKHSACRVMSQPSWNLGTDQLAAAGILAKDTSGTRALVGPVEWERGRMWEAVACPSGEPPDILPPPYSPTNNGKTTANNRESGTTSEPPPSRQVIDAR